ncbi:phytanoyl-CoA dioxygenase family protein [Hyphomonas adhaerens]|uniref:phytanoyl-CoA dioxygenase family protein n=1 Tax=Hyphomonas adhaerens TaxID=81029 RepID=UPI002357324D|nr:phytanoyl-CoA dioxygenase family protein [Hyphomonas adhaerens]
MSNSTRIISPDQRSAFERDGVICLRNILTRKEIRHLQNAVARQISGLRTSPTGYDFEALASQVWDPDGQVDTGAAERFDMAVMKEMVRADLSARPLKEEDRSEEQGMFFYDVAAWKSDRGVREVAFDSSLPELISDLLGARYLNFWEDTTFVKAPHTRQKTAFHQDLAYFQIDGEQCVIVWIALDPVTQKSGAMQYVRGSHKWGETYAPNVFISQTPFRSSPEKRCPDIEAEPDKYDIVSFDVEPGDVIIHHVKTVHGSGGNRSDSWRRAVSFRYCGDEVRYLDRPGAIQQVGVAHDLNDGDRLFSKDYPVVWPKPWPSLSLSDAYDLLGPAVQSSDEPDRSDAA